MPLDDSLQRLAHDTVPNQALLARVRARIMNRIEPRSLTSLVGAVVPSPEILVRLRSTILEKLTPLSSSPKIHSVLKWTAAFAVFVLLLRTMPFVFLTSTQADTSVQLLTSGPVSIFRGGVWQNNIEGPEMIRSAVMIKTGKGGHATLIWNNDGVFRLGEETTVRVHSVDSDLSTGPTATLVRGTVWTLGLLPPVTQGITLETSRGTVSLNSGSASITDTEAQVTVEVFDRGVTLHEGEKKTFLVTGEKALLRDTKPRSVTTMPTKVFTSVWASGNLAEDAVHRKEIVELQAERREEVAGILPTSVFYPAKRIAEEVDVFFALTHENRTGKRVEQANTRLNEALALIEDGEETEASEQFAAYRESLLALVSSEDDNLVKYLVQKQIEDASSALQAQEPDAVSLFMAAVDDVGAVVPDMELDRRNIEGYVLVDKLAAANRALASTQDLKAAATLYAEVQPYLKELLSEQDGVHPLLKKETMQLLASMNTQLESSVNSKDDPLSVAIVGDIRQYLPPEQAQLRTTAEELDRRVEAIFKSVMDFRHPTSRINTLRALIDEERARNPDDLPSLLRRLKVRLPPNFDGTNLVMEELKKLGYELR